MRIQIRKATKKDIKEIAELMKKELSKPPFNEKTGTRGILKSLSYYFKTTDIYVAVLDGKIIGVVDLFIDQHWEGPVIIIEDLAVDSRYRKQGIGKKLLDRVGDMAKKKKVKAIYFQTHRKSPSLTFYKKLGFRINKNRIFMEKILR